MADRSVLAKAQPVTCNPVLGKWLRRSDNRVQRRLERNGPEGKLLSFACLHAEWDSGKLASAHTSLAVSTKIEKRCGTERRKVAPFGRCFRMKRPARIMDSLDRLASKRRSDSCRMYL
jgi:hypothetical protein